MLLVRGFAEVVVDCESAMVALLGTIRALKELGGRDARVYAISAPENQVSLMVMTLNRALPSSEQQLSPDLA
jgi:hypothetical protein